jgi:DNA-binding winged helix-turn-helix (wHTH) protein
MITMTWPQYLRHQCRIGDFIISLSPMETELLSTLLIRYPGPVTIRELIEIVYDDPEQEPEWAESTVYGAIRQLAHKIGKFRIETTCRLGYRLCQFPSDSVKIAA